jgi:hypothetical protein
MVLLRNGRLRRPIQLSHNPVGVVRPGLWSLVRSSRWRSCRWGGQSGRAVGRLPDSNRHAPEPCRAIDRIRTARKTSRRLYRGPMCVPLDRAGEGLCWRRALRVRSSTSRARGSTFMTEREPVVTGRGINEPGAVSPCSSRGLRRWRRGALNILVSRRVAVRCVGGLECGAQQTSPYRNRRAIAKVAVSWAETNHADGRFSRSYTSLDRTRSGHMPSATTRQVSPAGSARGEASEASKTRRLCGFRRRAAWYSPVRSRASYPLRR